MGKLKNSWVCFWISLVYLLSGGIIIIEELIRLGPEKALTYVVGVIGIILMLIGICGMLFFAKWHSIEARRTKPENENLKTE